MNTTTAAPNDARVSLLDLRIDKFSDSGVVRLIAGAIQNQQRLVIANHNLHSVYLWYHQPLMRRFYSEAEYIHIDGMSLVLLGKLLGVPLTRENRAAALDYLPLIAEQAVAQQWRIFYLGSRPGVAAEAASCLRQQFPGLHIATHHGHFDADRFGAENRRVLAEINAFNPHILFVGMGMPRQEIWISDNREALKVNAIIPAGALMDYIAGEIPTAPRWLASIYLEWLYRLVSEPTRLWRRYLVEPWFVVGQVLKYCFRFKGRPVAAQDSHHE